MDLQKAEEIASKRERQEEIENYKKYHAIFDTTFDILRKTKEPLLLYGGLAIDRLMPTKYKIYEEYTLPDIDMFCVHPQKVATNLVKEFASAGHNAFFNEALHEGTYKVFVGGLQVADITKISKRAFDTLSDGKRDTAEGLFTVCPEYLRMSLHLILSKGDVASRWPKVVRRLHNYYKVFPPIMPRSQIDRHVHARTDHSDAINVVQELYKHLQSSDFVLMGAAEMEEMIGLVDSRQKGKVPEAGQMHALFESHGIPKVQIIVDGDIQDVAAKVVENMGGKLQASALHQDDFLPPHCFLSYKGTKLATIFQTHGCQTFNTFRGFRVATIHTMIQYYSSMLLSHSRFFNEEEHKKGLKEIVESLAVLHLVTRNSKRKLLQSLVIDCFGNYAGMITLRRQRGERMRKHKGGCAAMCGIAALALL